MTVRLLANASFCSGKRLSALMFAACQRLIALPLSVSPRLRAKILNAKNLRGALANQLAALSEQGHAALDLLAGKCSPWAGFPSASGAPDAVRITEVSTVLEAVVLLDRSCIDQPNLVAGLLQPIDQPVPARGSTPPPPQ